MKPPSFEYFDPETLEEAVGLLEQHGYDAKILAGGQSLVPLLNFRLARPAVLVDINKLRELDYIRAENGTLAIGAMTRQRQLEVNPLVQSKCGLLRDATGLIGHPQIRNRGTVGGSVAHADPSAELPAIVLALGGDLIAVGPEGRRTIGANDFFAGLMTTALGPAEILAEVRIPSLAPTAGWAFEEFAIRHGDFALAGAVAVVTLDEEERCAQARLTAIGVGEIPFRDPESEALLEGKTITDALLKDVADLMMRKVEPAEDLHASAEQRRHLVGVLSRRALKKAAQSALQKLKKEKP